MEYSASPGEKELVYPSRADTKESNHNVVVAECDDQRNGRAYVGNFFVPLELGLLMLAKKKKKDPSSLRSCLPLPITCDEKDALNVSV